MKAPQVPIDKLSAALRPAYELELSLGNRVQDVRDGQWDKCSLEILFAHALHFGRIREQLDLPKTVFTWECRDPHYPKEAGLKCRETTHSLTGPLPAFGTGAQP